VDRRFKKAVYICKIDEMVFQFGRDVSVNANAYSILS
jgi:hypothetical protein